MCHHRKYVSSQDAYLALFVGVMHRLFIMFSLWIAIDSLILTFCPVQSPLLFIMEPRYLMWNFQFLYWLTCSFVYIVTFFFRFRNTFLSLCLFTAKTNCYNPMHGGRGKATHAHDLREPYHLQYLSFGIGYLTILNSSISSHFSHFSLHFL